MRNLEFLDWESRTLVFPFAVTVPLKTNTVVCECQALANRRISPFDLFSLAGFVNLSLFSRLFASSAAAASDLPAAADGAPAVAAWAAAGFFFFPPILTPKQPLPASSLYNDAMLIHLEHPEQRYVKF